MTDLQSKIKMKFMNLIPEVLSQGNILCVVVMDQLENLQVFHHEEGSNECETQDFKVEWNWVNLGKISIRWADKMVCYDDESGRRCYILDNIKVCHRLKIRRSSMIDLQNRIKLKPMNLVHEVLSQENILCVVVIDQLENIQVFHYEEGDNELKVQSFELDTDRASLASISVQWVENIVFYIDEAGMNALTVDGVRIPLPNPPPPGP